MPNNLPRLILSGCALLFVAVSAFADTEFRVKRMTRTDVPLGKGQCDIRLRIDNEAEVSVRGDMVYVRTISGREARDDGSECNEPLPARSLSGFNFEIRDRRNDITLLSEPTQRSGYRAVVRIRDTDGGAGRYHFRLSWQMDGGNYGRDANPAPSDRRRGDYGRGVYPDDRRGDYGNDRRRDYGSDYGNSRRGDASSLGAAIEACGDAVADRITGEYRYSDVDIRSIRADNGPGRNDYVVGEATGRRGRANDAFSFSCRVDLNSGRVRTVDVVRR